MEIMLKNFEILGGEHFMSSYITKKQQQIRSGLSAIDLVCLFILVSIPCQQNTNG